MEKMTSITHLLLLLMLITTTTITKVFSMPARQNDGIIDSLKTGYYYIENGSIKSISRGQLAIIAQNSLADRQDTLSPNRSRTTEVVKFKPVVRYKETKTKRKKLFVPNFFG
ncbi:uncharacterized protein [Musca autumnalis]|uniref:uncharacterized protein n=1 Tax=Musca autumnalis TaxID=221902 RepID=UPI003CEB47E7